MPKRAGMIMKYWLGLRVLSSPISQTLSEMASISSQVSPSGTCRGHLHTSGEPGWINDGRTLGISKSLICDMGIEDLLSALKLPIPELEDVVGLL